jgi:TusA-related sulfurtransferase
VLDLVLDRNCGNCEIDWSKASHEIQSGTELKISSGKEGFRRDMEEVISQVNEALEENSSMCLARRHEMVVEYAERFQTVNDRLVSVVEDGLNNSKRIKELLRSLSQFLQNLKC